MAYVYPQAASLDGKPAVGNQQCVIMVEHYADAPAPARQKWKPGAAVRGNLTITEGTAIATFIDGIYPSNPSGNHAALYLSQDDQGVWVVDQYVGSNGIHKRRLRFKGKHPDGSFIDPVNNGEAFSVIV